MKIAIAASGNSLDADFAPRFGRSAYFVVVDSETEEWTALPNPGMGAGGGAGVQAAQVISNSGAQVAIGPNFGPNAFNALRAAGITMYSARGGSVRDVLAQYKAGQLPEIRAAQNVGRHH
jgi:predicted Fe-Mo cluster-binding NifX family protein